MTTVSRTSDVDLGVDTGVRLALDLIGRELEAEKAAVDPDRDPHDPAIAVHVYALGVLRCLQLELAERFRQAPA
jgi:hypothetical protein